MFEENIKQKIFESLDRGAVRISFLQAAKLINKRYKLDFSRFPPQFEYKLEFEKFCKKHGLEYKIVKANIYLKKLAS